MTKRTLLTTLAGLAACGALAPASAPAAPSYGAAAFQVELRGSQVSTWEYHVDTAKDNPCGGSKIDAFGDQMLRFKSGKKGRLLLGKPAGGKPTVSLMRDTKAFGFWEVPVTAERTGTWIPGDVDRSMCEGDNGGGVPPRKREDKDCGTREGQLIPDLEASGRSRTTLSGRTAEWTADPLLVPLTGESSGDTTLDETYKDCEFWEGGPYAVESEAGLLPAIEKLPVAAMLDPRKKRIVIDFSEVKEYREGPFAGKTIVAGKMILTRTGLVPRG